MSYQFDSLGKPLKIFRILLIIYASLYLINVILDLFGIRIINFKDSTLILFALTILWFSFINAKQEKEIKNLKKKIKDLEKGINEKSTPKSNNLKDTNE